jgi:hypothetical protein
MTATLARYWAAVPARTRPWIVGVLAVLLGAVGLTLALQRDTRVSLFAEPLRAEQVEEVAERLADWNVPFTVAADNVRVDGARRNDVLLRLAALGIPRAHLASLDDALAKAGPLTPQSILDAEQLDGRAGDLAAGLRGVAGVEDARVMIAAGRDATFADGGDAHQTTAPSASRSAPARRSRVSSPAACVPTSQRASPGSRRSASRSSTIAASPRRRTAALPTMPRRCKPRCNPPSTRPSVRATRSFASA